MPQLILEVHPDDLTTVAHLAALLDAAHEGNEYMTYGPIQDHLYALVSAIQTYSNGLTFYLDCLERKSIPGMTAEPPIILIWRAIAKALDTAIASEQLEPFQTE